MFKLSSLTKAMTEAINAAPDVDALSKNLPAPTLAPRIVAEYGNTHSATCLDYDPVQRLLAVGVDTGVKVFGADGLSVLLMTPAHLEPARRVKFVPSVGRVVRVSVESGVDVWDLKSQTLLASTRWPVEITSIAALRRTNFLLIGDRNGTARVATIRPGADGGVVAPRAYCVSLEQATGVTPWVLQSIDDTDTSETDTHTKSSVVEILPQPGFETARVLFAYANGRLSLWDLHGKKCAAMNGASSDNADKQSKLGELRCATWVGLGGGVIASGHDAGAVCLWLVLALPKPGSTRVTKVLPITVARIFHPQPGSNVVERMPVRGIVSRAFGAAGSAMAGTQSGHERNSSSSSVLNELNETKPSSAGVLASVGGEEPGSLDPLVLVPLDFDASAGSQRPCEARKSNAVSLPYFGPVTCAALASPPFHPETTASVATLSEGGQIHVHDARNVDGANYAASTTHTTQSIQDFMRGAESTQNNETNDDEASTSAENTKSESQTSVLGAEEVTETMPRLATRCAPAAASASPGLLKTFATEIDAAAIAFRSRNELWGDAWPLTGGAPDDAGRWFKGSSAPRNVVAAAAQDGGQVHVCVEGAGRFVPVSSASPGPNAGMSPRDRTVTQCHLACGGAMLIVGRACGAVEVHVAISVQNQDSPGTIRMLDGGLDLKQPPGEIDSTNSKAGYRLVGELGAHTAKVTCIETQIDSERALLFVGDANGAASVSCLREGLLQFHISPFADKNESDNEGIAAAAFCTPVVGTVSFENESEAFVESDLPESDANENNVSPPTASSEKQPQFNGAELLTLTSTGSSLAFLNVATGEVLGKPCRPKTTSKALAVAPLDAFGASGIRRSDRRALRQADDGLVNGSNWFWFTKAGSARDDLNQTSSTGDINAKTSDSSPSTPHAMTALVAVASTEALRVYPANGAIRGERHTLKKVVAQEPLVAATLVTPRGGDEMDNEDVSQPSVSAFAAVSQHGRILLWALPGLVPVASCGPLPPVSSADATCFSLDASGVFFTFGGGGQAVAKLALAQPARGAKARPESGVLFWDEDMAQAADAADEAAEIAASEKSTGPGSSRLHAEHQFHVPVKDSPSQTSTPSKDLQQAGRNLLRGDTRSAIASFGSVIKGAKEKAKEAAESFKDKAKSLGDAVKAAVEEEELPRATATDLAMLFVDAEVKRPGVGTPATKQYAPEKKKQSVSQKLFAGFKSTKNEAPKSSKASVDERHETSRAELFRPSSVGSGSTGASVPRMSSADEIRAKYGKSKPKDLSSTSAQKSNELRSDLHETRDKLAERGEKLASLQDKTQQMQSDAEDFHTMAQKLAKQQKSWW